MEVVAMKAHSGYIGVIILAAGPGISQQLPGWN